MSRSGAAYLFLAVVMILPGLGCTDVVKFGDGWSAIAKLEGYTRDCQLAPLNNGKSIAVDQAGRVHITYRMRRKQGDGWSGWQVEYKRLSPTPEGMKPDRQHAIVDGNLSHGQPCITTQGTDRIAVAWRQDISGTPYILTALSYDGGVTWPGSVRQWTPTANGSNPSADFDSRGRLHLAWRTRESIKYLRTNQSLTGYECEQLIHKNWILTTRQPSVVVDDSDLVHVGWSYTGLTSGYDVAYARSTDCGDSWTTTAIAGTGSGDDPPVSMASDYQGHIYLLWSGIRLRRSGDRGASWDSTRNLTPGSFAAIATGPQNHVHVVFVKDGAVWYITSSDYSASWTQPFRLTDKAVTTAKSPDVAVSRDGTVHVVWQQYQSINEVNQLCYRVGR